MDMDGGGGGGGDWRDHLTPEIRSRIASKIFESVKKGMPNLSEQHVLNEPQRIAVLIEEKIYSIATDQSEYLRKISLKMLSMETRDNRLAPGNAQVIPNQNNPIQG